MPDKVYLGRRVRNLEKSPPVDVTAIRMIATDDVEFDAGDGTPWEIESPWASQEQVNWLLSQMEDWEYQPYKADAIKIDPAVELGDYVTAGSVYSGLFSENVRYGTMVTSEIAATQSQDIEHEFPAQTASERQITRLAKQMAAEFKVTAKEISAKVSEVGGDNNTFGWSMTVEGMHWYANGSEVMKCTQAGLEVSGHIKGGTIEIGSNFSVDEDGNMTASSATLKGTLTVGGANISASTLRSGASSGYNWANGSYGGTSPWQYSLTGGGYGFNFNNMSYGTVATRQPINASSLLVDGKQYVELSINFLDYYGNSRSYTVLGQPSG